MSDSQHASILDSFGGISTPQSEWSSIHGGLHSRDSSVSGPRAAFGRGIPMLASNSASTGNNDDAQSDTSLYSDQEQDYMRGNSDIFINAPDSPAVPQRLSSVSHPRERSFFDPNSSSPPDPGAASPSEPSRPAEGGTGGEVRDLLGSSPMSKDPSRMSGISARSELSPKIAARTSSSSSRSKKDGTEAELEAHLQQSADAEDPNRPRTLKEARALAKERARLRKEARESESAPASSKAKGKSTTSPVVAPRHEAKPSMDKETAAAALANSDERRSEERPERKSFASDRSLSVYSHEEDPETGPRMQNEDRRVLGHQREPSQGKAADPETLVAMDNLQAAVGEALEDLSFGSSTATETTSTTVPPSAVATVAYNPVDEVKTPVASEATLPSVAAASKATTASHQRGGGAGSFDARAATSNDSGFYPSFVPRSATMSGDLQRQQSDRGTVSLPASTTQPSFPRHVSVPSESSTSSRLGPGRSAMRPARLDVFGKTIPWPAAFDPTAVLEQKRLAPWERARGYAHYCNDLCKTPSGLQVWLEVVQRPAASEQQRRVGRHNRGLGTDASGYAASVRSDATFPIRGDGGKAKEIQTAFQPIPESPPSGLPSNIPYPSLVNQTMVPSASQQHSVSSRSSSTLNDDHHTPASLSRASASAKGAAGNFFSSLGRRGSTRRTAAGMGGIGIGIQPLTSNMTTSHSSGGVGGSSSSSGSGGGLGGGGGRGAKGKVISGPVSSPPTAFNNPQSHLEGAKPGIEGLDRTQSPATMARAQSSPHVAPQTAAQRPSQEVQRAQDPATLAKGFYSPRSTSPAEHQPTVVTRGLLGGRVEGSPLTTPTSATSARTPMGPRAYSQANSAVSAASSATFLTAPASPRDSPSSNEQQQMQLQQQQHLQQLQQQQQQQALPKGQYYGLSSTGGIYGTPQPNEGRTSSPSSPLYAYLATDYAGEKRPSPLATGNEGSPSNESPMLGSSTASQHTVQERDGQRGRSAGLGIPGRRTSSTSVSSNSLRAPGQAEDGGGSSSRKESFSSTRASNGAGDVTDTEEEALEKLADVLQDADRPTLIQYLRRANGNNLVAIGDYFQDQATGKLRR
ncbi:hypothetical protein FA10DRAFT_264769 [Acaromyces ingoldii]|uniref:CUE domain-containing protein n=1 Tax=Acaromyces ingoldii TaxID=215250 RepID=A0A316Z1Y9_9BASI|nr:hypothetical protein FA10DRAFT_264769 [Acaromyces ingoldii]PWN94205.1 hypothetical protein FA10DRAFT_264769 [Acaromyces ingoldii]